jgi:hypothetical protein
MEQNAPVRSKLDTLARTIAEREGFFVTERQAREQQLKWPTVAQRNHNPGNLRRWKGFPTVKGYAVFPDDATGWAKLRKQIELDRGRGLTLRQFIEKWAPPTENDTEGYIRFVCARVGVAETALLSELV